MRLIDHNQGIIDHTLSQIFLILCKIGEVERVLQYLSMVSERDCFLGLREACMRGHLEIIKILLLHCDPSSEDNKCLKQCVNYKQFEALKLLLQDERVDPSMCLFHAVMMEYNEQGYNIVKLLLEDKRWGNPPVGNIVKFCEEFRPRRLLNLVLRHEKIFYSTENMYHRSLIFNILRRMLILY